MHCTFKQKLEALDVWSTKENILSLPQHNQLLDYIRQLADQTQDFFCPKYQNIIDPNLFLYYSNLDNNRDLNNTNLNEVEGIWMATDVQVTLDPSANKFNVHVTSPIQDFSLSRAAPLYCAVNTMLTTCYPLFCSIKNWKPNNVLESAHARYDYAGGEYPLYKNNHDTPKPFTNSDTFQVVVKCQRVIVEPGVNYKGLWHDEGLNENVIAVIVYYTNVSESLRGGEIQFASKGGCEAEFGWRSNINESWKARDKIIVSIQTGTTVVFSNYQTVHRVLEINNTSSMAEIREFVCVFVIDPRSPLVSTQRYATTQLVLQDFPNDLVNVLFAYDDHPSMKPMNERKRLRKSVFTEQMKPKQLGTFLMYSTGNGDCQTVGWASATQLQETAGQHLFGTDSEPVSDDNDEYGSDSDCRKDYPRLRRKRYQRQDKQTVAF